MDERGANIDLIFRNGLKDFEALPPQDVWDNVHSIVKRKKRPFILLRAAALITVVLTMSFLAYKWSREVSPLRDGSVIASIGLPASPETRYAIFEPPAVAAEGKKTSKKSENILVDDNSDALIEPEKLSSAETPYSQETRSLSLNKALPLHRPLLSSLKSLQSKTFRISESDMQYIPEINPLEVNDRWSIAAMASPTYYSRFSLGNDEISKQLMASEQSLISYSGGVALSYKINKRISIQSGLYYSSLGQVVNGINSFSGFQKYDYNKGDHNFEVPTSNGTVYTNNADVFLVADGTAERIITNYTSDVFNPEKASLQYVNNTMRQNFSYLELPITLRYKIVDKTIDINVIGGLSYNLLVKNSVYTISDGAKYMIGKTEGLNPLSISSSLGMGMGYNFSDNFSFNLEPIFRYYVNPFNEMTGSKVHPYSFGVFSGVSYKF